MNGLKPVFGWEVSHSASFTRIGPVGLPEHGPFRGSPTHHVRAWAPSKAVRGEIRPINGPRLAIADHADTAPVLISPQRFSRCAAVHDDERLLRRTEST